ncbi:MAG: hypothetical protein J5476_08080 [Lachnospiraceae bacterium]|nr:hypothetical protein [Lachnospiraceae bacterium]
MAEKTKKRMLQILNKTLSGKSPLAFDPNDPPCIFLLHQPALPGKKNEDNGSSVKDCNHDRS